MSNQTDNPGARSSFNFNARRINIRESQIADTISQVQQINNSGVRIAQESDVTNLIVSLREISKSFPKEQQKKILLDLDGLEQDVSKNETQNSNRTYDRLKRLIAVGTTILALSGGATTFSGDLNEISENAAEMSEKAKVFIENVKELAGELQFKVEEPTP